MPPRSTTNGARRLAGARGAILEALREGPGTLWDFVLRCPEVSEHNARRALESLVAEGTIEERHALSPGSRQHARYYSLPDPDRPASASPAPEIGFAEDKAVVLAELRRAGRPLSHADVMALLPGLSHFRVRSALFGLEASRLVVTGYGKAKKSSAPYRVRVYSPAPAPITETAS